MSLRDYFAGQAVAATAETLRCYNASPDEIARHAYAIADAMLAARDRT